MPSVIGHPDIDDLWREIDYQVSWLHGRWAIYRQLYGTSEDRVAVLNKSAGTFAFMLQDILLQDVQLGLAKLGDAAVSRGFENMTLATLSHKVMATGALTTELPALLDAYAKACTRLRERRNKWIAHFDLQTMLHSKASLNHPSREEIELALDALRRFMNCISLCFTGSQTAYEQIVLDSDGDSLIATLKRGLRYRELVRNGTIAHDDLRASESGKV